MKPIYHIIFIGGNLPPDSNLTIRGAVAALHTYEALRAAGGPVPLISRGDVIVPTPTLKLEAAIELAQHNTIDMTVVTDSDYPVPHQGEREVQQEHAA